MTSQRFVRRIYELFVQKSLVDDMDVEIIEDALLSSQHRAFAPFKFIVLLSVVTTAAGGVFGISYQFLVLLISPAFLIAILNVRDYLCYSLVSLYVSASCSFDAAFHCIVAAVRSREIAFFG
ncbi:unnamed protein product [Gongylonema pulchrum]|uniref:Transmembrane protein n=1 Tax=Gongylonema pulchrum TaxID=637853 RepID=A0A183DUS9_9BILA|nr:unnamed protein product [Gongylonema pulchrum]